MNKITSDTEKINSSSDISFTNLETRIINKVHSISETIRHSIENMDIQSLNNTLSADITYQDYPKKEFIKKLSVVFKTFRKFGNTSLSSYSGSCGSCNTDSRGYVFVGNNSSHYMTLLIEMEKGEISDLMECSKFIADHKSLNPKDRIKIEDYSKFKFDELMGKYAKSMIGKKLPADFNDDSGYVEIIDGVPISRKK
jgi:hypothetical protein